MRRTALPLLAATLAGCSHFRTTSTLSATDVGQRGTVPAGFASGETNAVYLFGLGPFGSDDQERAIARARGKRLETTLTDITVERSVSCVFECQYPLIRHVKVVASGSLVMPTGYKDHAKPEKPEPIISQRFPNPSLATLVERLQGLYLSDPAEAESYYRSLKDETREELGKYIVAEMGLAPIQGDVYRAPETMPAARCKFLAWFLEQHTVYRLSGESCP